VFTESEHSKLWPEEQVPIAPFAPHPVHWLPTTIVLGSSQESVPPQLPATVLQPVSSLQLDSQHPAPTVQSVTVGSQVQLAAHVPAPSQ
jgi:hypothetical protein